MTCTIGSAHSHKVHITTCLAWPIRPISLTHHCRLLLTFDNKVRMALSHVVLNGESFRKADCSPSMFIIDKLQGNRFQFSFYLRLLVMKK